ncbi:Gfo/Idh/MocA family protein [Erwinia pyrifoliae]|uniref:Gfo/Idh/MocA family protein n=1 Tax=Erwinia pyrifoliae TaxID=79967 RepID=UPI00223B95AD|nr:Gfo/Idh/MocA family oxidoreductase [Erwinia pyrifoliae]MCT2386122.1 Gfo/Idh/MocA family oxidoreductase [Erwinia pyrifoliae]MCU8588281.1 Gfo/Idh/MocA family oxidoreductase [Erwinia pyrifoliae]
MIIGIVGCGGIARAHVCALSLNTLVTGLALYDVNEDSMRQLSEIGTLPVIRCQNLKQLADMSQGFVICTPNNLHVSVAEEVLRYKPIPFVCEKPLSTDLNSARYLQSIAPEGSIVSFNYRYNRVIATIMQLIKDRELGDLHFFSAEFNKNSALTRHHLTWRDSARQSKSKSKSNGALGDLSCHLLDLFCLMGESPVALNGIRTVKGTRVAEKSDGLVEVDDNGYVMGCSEKGAYFRIHASKSETGKDLGLHMQIVLEKGEIGYSTHHENSLLLSLFNDTATETIAFDGMKRLPDPPRELPFWSDSFIHLHNDWCGLIKHGTSAPMLADLSSGLHIQEIIEAF